MKLRFAALLCIVLSPIFSHAQNGGASITINPGGSTTQTAATTSFVENADNNAQQAPPCLYPMKLKDYKAAKANIVSAKYEETKLSTAKAILTSNCLSTDEVMDVCNAFGFEGSKLDFAKTAYSRTTDPANYSKVNSVFSSATSKTDLNNYISSHAR